MLLKYSITVNPPIISTTEPLAKAIRRKPFALKTSVAPHNAKQSAAL